MPDNLLLRKSAGGNPNRERKGAKAGPDATLSARSWERRLAGRMGRGAKPEYRQDENLG
jgi:hypothetical protein